MSQRLRTVLPKLVKSPVSHHYNKLHSTVRKMPVERSDEPQVAGHRLGTNAAANHPSQRSQGPLEPFSPRLLSELRAYWKHDRPKNYIFPGKTNDVPLSGATIQRTCKMAAAQAHIKKLVTPHTLRHSFATGLLEAGVDLMAISKLLGHSSFTTPMIYLHCRKQHLDSTPSPIDWLPARQCPKWIDPSLQLPSEPSPTNKSSKPHAEKN